MGQRSSLLKPQPKGIKQYVGFVPEAHPLPMPRPARDGDLLISSPERLAVSIQDDAVGPQGTCLRAAVAEVAGLVGAEGYAHGGVRLTEEVLGPLAAGTAPVDGIDETRRGVQTAKGADGVLDVVARAGYAVRAFYMVTSLLPAAFHPSIRTRRGSGSVRRRGCQRGGRRSHVTVVDYAHGVLVAPFGAPTAEPSVELRGGCC